MTADQALRAGGHLCRVRYAGKVWRLMRGLRCKVHLTRDVRVRGRLELGGYTANHWRRVTIDRPGTVTVELCGE